MHHWWHPPVGWANQGGEGQNDMSAGAFEAVYLDYQATTPADPRVVEAMQPYWSGVYGNPHSADHAFGWQADAAVEAARAEIAVLIGADPDEIIFTSGATEANNLAIIGIARAAPPPRRRIVVSAIEHKCVLAAARAAAEEGFEVNIVPVGGDGIVDVESIAATLDDRVALVSVMSVNNEIGTIQPIEEIGELCKSHGIIFHTDAAQALSFLEIDVNKINADLMSLSAHKVYGPKGIGALYVRRDSKIKPKPIIHGGGQEFGLRSGTLSTPLCVGFGEACRIITMEGGSMNSPLSDMRDYFLKTLMDTVPGLHVNGTMSTRHPGNLNVQFSGLEAEIILNGLQPHVAASTGSACTSGQPEPSHVLRAIGLSNNEAECSIRFSLGRFTTIDKIEGAASMIRDAVLRLQSATS
jgi:cysteine desulfurase